MHFASDNSGPVPAQVLDSLARANHGYAMAYGTDPLTEAVEQKLRDLFEAPDAAVYLTATGTSANVIALATLVQPYQAVFCSPVAHIQEDECNAPEFYTGGAKLVLVPGSDRMTPEALRATIESEGNRGVHGPERGAVSITNVTERGNVYTLADLRALTAVARDYDLPVHLDGARFANACVALGCTPAEMSWKAGVDVAVFGGTKNGLMGVEAVIFFNPDMARSFAHRRKRGGHLFSKSRFLAAQMDAYLADDLWHDLATRANAACARLARGLRQSNRVRIENDPTANMIYASLPRAWHQRASAAGARYHLSGGTLYNGDPDAMLSARFVTDWSMTDAQIDAFLNVALR